MIDPQIPTVVIHNNIEVFDRFLRRTADPVLIHQRRFRGDRALFWLGTPKLVCVTAPIADAQDLCHRWGYDGTQVLVPDGKDPHLCADLLQSPRALEQMAAYAGAGRCLKLVPYAATPELYALADTLQQQYHLDILLPESPAKENLWLRDLVDTKSGFRSLAAGWLAPLGVEQTMPLGFICTGIQQASEAAAWFLRRKSRCIVKADSGESGNGNYILTLEDESSPALLAQKLAAQPFLHNDLLVVEELIENPKGCSPSLEMFVPPLGAGEPAVTYLSIQIFEKFGCFAGAAISRDDLTQNWYPQLARSGRIIAKKIQTMGYVGFFDLDAVVDGAGNVYLLEINARRTGGTYVHELAVHLMGEHYLDQAVLLSANRILCPGIRTYPDLVRKIEDLFYIPGYSSAGIVMTVTSTLPESNFGCVFIAPTPEEIRDLQSRLFHRLQ